MLERTRDRLFLDVQSAFHTAEAWIPASYGMLLWHISVTFRNSYLPLPALHLRSKPSFTEDHQSLKWVGPRLGQVIKIGRWFSKLDNLRRWRGVLGLAGERPLTKGKTPWLPSLKASLAFKPAFFRQPLRGIAFGRRPVRLCHAVRPITNANEGARCVVGSAE
jgi:hypothetical protein